MTDERMLWQRVTGMLGDDRLKLGRHWSYNLLNDPKRLAFVFSRYKFAARMGSKGRRVLELGSSEGIGTPILAESASSYLGVDMDEEAIEAARRNWRNEKIDFVHADFLGRVFGEFDTVVSLDVVEHIEPDASRLFFSTLAGNLGSDGVGIVGTPNETSAPFASEASRRGHINLFDAARLKAALGEFFHTVFIFSMNDEIVHTGFHPMAHFLLGLGCYKRPAP